MTELNDIITLINSPAFKLLAEDTQREFIQKRDSLQLKNVIDFFSNLHVAKVKGHKAPHKAVLLLSIIDLIEEGIINTPHIELTVALEKKFKDVWKRYLGDSAIFTPDVAKPYFHMQHEPFWRLVEHEELGQLMVAEDASIISEHKETKTLPSGSYSLKAMHKAFAYAAMDEQLFHLLHNADARAMLRVVLINTYLTDQPTKSMPVMSVLLAAFPWLVLVA